MTHFDPLQGGSSGLSQKARDVALARYGILDTPTEPGFDDIATLAARALAAPIAIVNLIASDRQWFKAEIGIGVREMPLDVSICVHAIRQDDFLVVPDTTRDDRFAHNSLVTVADGLRFYAGALLRTSEGLPIGTLCVLDRVARPDGVTDLQRHTLEILARQVMAQLELRRTLAEQAARTHAFELETRQRNHAEAALQQSEDRYWTLFNSLDAGFCIIEMRYDADDRPADYKFVEVNRAFAHQTGLADAEDRWMRELAPAHEQHWFDIYGKVARTGEAIRFEQAAEALDGRWYDVHAFRIGAPARQQVAILFTDISDRRRAELSVHQLNETLDARVAEMVAEREQAHEALRQSQKLEAIGQLTGGVAHDFNNLLTVIRGSVDLLRRPGLREEKRAHYIDAIGSTADRAAKLTGQLLSFARRQALIPTLFDIGESLRELADMASTLTGPRVRFDLCMPADRYFTLADRPQFETAIVNMIVNARDAMGGVGELVIAGGAVSGIPAIRAHPPVPGDFIVVTVSDTGRGIASDDLARIFEPFFTTKRVGEGPGLGLSQVFGFAKQSGGEIRVDSAEGAGTIFTLYLPRAYADRTAEELPPDPALQFDGAGVYVLVVEDNPDVGAFATAALEELGYRSLLARDAVAALAELADDPARFDIVFSDVVMPGTNGIDLAGEIRRLHPRLPIVLTSGYSHVLAQNGQHGFELLHKPYSVEQLARVLRKAMEWRRA